MKIGDKLYFSPKYKFTQLDWDNKKELIEAFKDRVKGFYLNPAKKLNEAKYSFAAGILCITAIDFLARIETGLDRIGKRFEKWLKDNIEEFDKQDPDCQSRTLAYRFYDEFRNGLVHEGRIKNAGQFSCEIKELVEVTESVMIVNPEKLLQAIEKTFDKYIGMLEKEGSIFQIFKCALIIDFQRDVEYASR